MIKKNNQTIGTIYKGDTLIGKIYKGTVLVYEAWKKLVKQGLPPLTLTKCKANKLLNYQIYGNSKQGELPDGYTQLEYIESTGTQYIDLNYTPSNETRIDIDFQVTTLGAGRFAGSTTFDTKAFSIGMGINKNFSIRFYSATAYTFSGDTNRHIATLNKNNFYLDGVLKKSFPTNTFTSNYKLSLFRYGEGTGYLGLIKLYSAKIYTSGNMEYNLIPCKNSTGVVGLYDTINNVFYTNAGTGDFTAGPEMPNPDNPIEIQNVGDNETGLPLGYTQLDYIQSTGTQYINTGISGNNNNLSFNITYEWIELPVTNQYLYVFGNKIDEESNSTRILQFGNDITYINLNTKTGEGTSTLRWNRTINTKYNDTFSSTLYTSNTQTVQITNNKKGNQNNNNILLLQPNSSSQSPKIKVYLYKIYDNNILVRDFIPCKNSNNVVGLYDLVNDVFYTNSGTGEFIAGNEIANGGYKIPVKVSGKNLSDGTLEGRGYFINASGVISAEPYSGYSPLIEVEPNTTYTFSGYTVDTKAGNKRLHAYDKNGNWISQIVYTPSQITTVTRYSITGTTPSNAKYVRFSLFQSDINLQLEEGSTATDYEEYFNRTDNIYLDEPLRKIGDADAVKLPSGYTQLEYIESTGTQYIDTGFAPTNNTFTTIDYEKLGNGDVNVQYLFGVYNIGYGYAVQLNSGSSAYIWGSTDSGGGQPVNPLNTRNKIQFSKDGFYRDGVELATLPTTTFTASKTMYLFWTNGTSRDKIRAKIYSCQIMDNDKLVRNFIPCKNSNNVIGMYDIVNDTFYTNQGTGTFTAGPEIYADYIDYENQKVYRNVVVDDDTGTLPIDQSYHGVIDNTGTTVELPDILLNKGTNIVDVETSLTPSNLLVKYKGKE